MSRRGRCSNSDGVTDMIIALMVLAFALPIGAAYWAFKGNTETKRLIGMMGLIFFVIVGLFGMITG